MTSIQFPVGTGYVDVRLDDEIVPDVLRKRAAAVPVDEATLVSDALDTPIGSEPLTSIAAAARTACIVVCDITRPVPNRLFLRPIVMRLCEAGVPEDAIRILVATGLHRPNLGEELQRLIGDPWILERIRIENHDAADDDAHADLGETSNGVPIRIDRRFVDADVKVVTGLVEPHFMAGWSGGPKVIAPGIAHHTTIRRFHSPWFMEHPAARTTNLAGNPLRQAQLEIADRIQGPILGVNTVLDEHRALVDCTFGDVVESHRRAVDVADGHAVVTSPKRYSTIVTSAGGAPLDQTFYQTVKAMVVPLDIVEPGGDLIVIASCAEGLGSEEFRDAQRRLVAAGPNGFLDDIADKRLADIDEWQTEQLAQALTRYSVTLHAPDLPSDDVDLVGVALSHDVVDAVERSVRRHGRREVAFIPEGPYVAPRYGDIDAPRPPAP